MSLKVALPFYVSTSNDLDFLLLHIPHTWQHLVFVLDLDHSNRCAVSMAIFFCVECLSLNIMFWYSSRLLDLCSCNLILFRAVFVWIYHTAITHSHILLLDKRSFILFFFTLQLMSLWVSSYMYPGSQVHTLLMGMYWISIFLILEDELFCKIVISNYAISRAIWVFLMLYTLDNTWCY